MITTSLYRPAWWLPHAHMQTLWSTLKSRGRNINQHRERIATPDGDFLDLDWTGSGDGPIVIILHGLTGSSDSTYVKGLQRSIDDLGWRTVTLNFRGCSGSPNLTIRSYHSGETEDIAYVYQHVNELEPDTPLMAVGYSLGGNVLLKWLGQNKHLGLFAAVAVSVPFRLDNCADRMDRGFSKIYQRQLITELKEYLQEKIDYFASLGKVDEAEHLKNIANLNNINNFWQFDHLITAPLHGFTSGMDYYQRSSCRQYLAEIQLPTLIIQAKDDPFMTLEGFPKASELSPTTTLELSERGGHVGFVEGDSPVKHGCWLDKRIPEWLVQQFEACKSSLRKAKND